MILDRPRHTRVQCAGLLALFGCSGAASFAFAYLIYRVVLWAFGPS